MMLAERAIATNSLISYKNDLIDFNKFLIKNSINELTTTSEHIRSYVEYLAKNQISPRSINRKLSSLKGYYTFAPGKRCVHCGCDMEEKLFQIQGCEKGCFPSRNKQTTNI